MHVIANDVLHTAQNQLIELSTECESRERDVEAYQQTVEAERTGDCQSQETTGRTRSSDQASKLPTLSPCIGSRQVSDGSGAVKNTVE